MQTLIITPITFRQACAFVLANHRHHKPPQGHKFSVGLSAESQLVGVAIVGRPVSRMLDDGFTLEVTRLCTDGTKNACSKLYAVAGKVGRVLGYHQMITYTLNTEKGISLKAAGWICLGLAGGGSWDTPSRRRQDQAPTQPKLKYTRSL
jgi:hypothetical protein